VSERHIADQMADMYATEMDRLAVLARAVTTVRLDWLLTTINRADALGPILHPTAYRDADLDSQRRLVEAAIAFRSVVAGLEERFSEWGRP
jgi:hypothetical protein